MKGAHVVNGTYTEHPPSITTDPRVWHTYIRSSHVFLKEKTRENMYSGFLSFLDFQWFTALLRYCGQRDECIE